MEFEPEQLRISPDMWPMLNGLRVTVRRIGNRFQTTTGLVVAATKDGLLVKPKGQILADMIEVHDIFTVHLMPQKEFEVTRTKLQPVTFGSCRKHLADRHGYTLQAASSVSESDAWRYHSSHELHRNLGHYHEHVAESELAKVLNLAQA